MFDSSIKAFCDTSKFHSLVKEATCFKTQRIYHALPWFWQTNILSFDQWCTIETGLSDFYKMVLTVMKMHFRNRKSRIITYRKKSDFEMKHSWLLYSMKWQTKSVSLPNWFWCLLKRRYLWTNHKLFINHEIAKAIMTRTRNINSFSEKKKCWK